MMAEVFAKEKCGGPQNSFKLLFHAIWSWKMLRSRAYQSINDQYWQYIMTWRYIECNVNKSNSTSEAVRGDANLTRTSNAYAFFYSNCIIKNFFTLKMKIKVTVYTSRNEPIRWQIWSSIKVILEHFSLAFIIFQIFTLQISWLWKWDSTENAWLIIWWK